MALGYEVLHVLELFNFNIGCIRVKFELLNYGWIVGYIYIVMNIGLWAQVAVLIIDCYIGLFGTSFMPVLYLGRAPRTKETLPDFREKCRVARRSRVLCGLTGSQQTLGFWGVTHYHVVFSGKCLASV